MPQNGDEFWSGAAFYLADDLETELKALLLSGEAIEIDHWFEKAGGTHRPTAGAH
jgi:hypothetical protein